MGLTNLTNMATTENKTMALLDQHIHVIKEHSSLLIPAAGFLAVGLRFHEPLREFGDLIHGLISNIVESMTGKKLK